MDTIKSSPIPKDVPPPLLGWVNTAEHGRSCIYKYSATLSDGMTTLIGLITDEDSLICADSFATKEDSGEEYHDFLKTIRINDTCALGFWSQMERAGEVLLLMLGYPDWTGGMNFPTLIQTLDNMPTVIAGAGYDQIKQLLDIAIQRILNERGRDKRFAFLLVGKSEAKKAMCWWNPDTHWKMQEKSVGPGDIICKVFSPTGLGEAPALMFDTQRHVEVRLKETLALYASKHPKHCNAKGVMRHLKGNFLKRQV